MTEVRVTYDAVADAAYIFLTDPRLKVRSARMYACDPIDVEIVRIGAEPTVRMWHCATRLGTLPPHVDDFVTTLASNLAHLRPVAA